MRGEYRKICGQQKIQQKSVEKKEEEEEQSIEEVEISVMEPEEDSSGAIEQISFYSAAQDLATPPENWKMGSFFSILELVRRVLILLVVTLRDCVNGTLVSLTRLYFFIFIFILLSLLTFNDS